MQSDCFKVGYSGQIVTPWGGLSQLYNFCKSSGLFSAIRSWSLPMPKSNRGYDPCQMIEQMLCSIWMGTKNLSQLDLTRPDPAVSKLFGWHKIGGHETVESFFCRFDQKRSTELMRQSYSCLFSSMGLSQVVLDVDSTALPRHGSQEEESVRGYNPEPRGRPVHHQIIAMVSGVKMVANMWLRSGNLEAANNLTAFLEQTLEHLCGTKVGLLRADSGFWCGQTFEYLREQGIFYIVSTKITQRLQCHMVENVNQWVDIDDRIQCAEMQYQGQGWAQAERIVIVRQRPLTKSEECARKQLALFEDDPYQNQWRYSMMTTNLESTPAEVWRMYQGRADCESRIKELKEDFGMDSFVLRNFWATQAGLSICMLAYNMVNAFRLLRTYSNANPKGDKMSAFEYYNRKAIRQTGT